MTESERIDEVQELLGFGRSVVPAIVMVCLANMVTLQMTTASLLNIPLPFRCFASSSASSQPDGVAYLVPETLNPDATSAAIEDMLTSGERIFNSECLDASSPPTHLFQTHNASASPFPSLEIIPKLTPTGLPSCPYIEYDHSLYISSIMSEFNLVCENMFKRPLFLICSSMGSLVGGLVSSGLADRYGRRQVLLVATFLALPFQVGLFFVPWFPAVLLFQFITLASSRAIIITSVTLVMESIPSHGRSVVGVLMSMPFYLFMALFALASYYLREWRRLYLMSSVTVFILAPLVFMVEESPRWLVQHGKGARAVEQLKRAAAVNKVQLPQHILASLEKIKAFQRSLAAPRTGCMESARGCVRNMREYFQYSAMVKVMIGVPLLWFLVGIAFHIVVLSASNFSSTHAELYVGLNGLVGIAAMALITPIAKRIGRRPLLGGGCLLCAGLVLLDLLMSSDLEWLRWLMAVLSMFAIFISYQILYVYAAELFPTVIRSRGFGMSNCVGLTSVAVVPLVTDLLVPVIWWGAGAVMVACAVGVCTLFCILPETINVTLPDTPQEMQNMAERGSSSSSSKDSAVV